LISNIEIMLRNYKENKAFVATTLARIAAYEELLTDNNLEDYILENVGQDLSMPKVSGYRSKSPVENCLIKKSLDADELKEMIKDEQSRIFMKKMEVEQIDTALTSLTSSEKFIIESKYFDGMFWRDIERNYNHRFRLANSITEDRLKKINREALGKMDRVLMEFCTKWKIDK
jgi:DNA-directed RNA polymerase sigma subunit (sigma70/sigma32)